MGWVLRTRGWRDVALAKALRSRKSRSRRVLTLLIPAIALGVLAVGARLGMGDRDGIVARRLLSSGECPTDMADWQDSSKGGFIPYILGVLFMFLGIAIVCDDFFVASLEAISENLNLSEDVAGATFMAAGSSAPELFSSAMSLVNENSGNELGVAAIVGSAVFNILVIVGLTAACAGRTLDIDWRPLMRDCMFYGCSIGTTLIIFQDAVVYWYEGAISVGLYLLYVGFMVINEPVMNVLDSWEKKHFPESHAAKMIRRDAKAESKNEARQDKADKLEKVKSKAAAAGETSAAGAAAGEGETAEEAQQQEQEEEEEEEEDSSPFSVPEDWKEYPLWALSLPWYAAFTVTIPPCEDPKWEKYYVLSFIMSILWIMLISYFMIDWTAMIGCIIGIDQVVMGVTLLAAGTSIPDAMSSVMVAKQGMGDMAVANAVGSNVFDIWLGLGLPWLVYLPFQDGGKQVINVDRLDSEILILAGVLITYFSTIVFSGFTLTVKVGYVFMALYLVYIMYIIVLVWLVGIYD